MTQDEIIEMLAKVYGVAWTSKAQLRDLTAFAKLVAEHEEKRLTDAAMKSIVVAIETAMALEREACAKLCETYDQREMFNDEDMAVADSCAKAIRARGQE